MTENSICFFRYSLPLLAIFLTNSFFSTEHYSKNSQSTKHDCIFCQRLQRGELTFIAQFKYCFVVKDNFPVSKGHLLIIPYEHIENWFIAKDEIQRDMIHAANEVKRILDAEYHPDGYNIGMNCGSAAGQTVMHLHMHLIPRYAGDMEDPRGGVRGVIPSKQKH